MKVIKRLIAWSLISLAIQFIVLYYINNEYFKQSSSFEVVQVDTAVNHEKKELTIPNNATNVDCSYDGKYISYFIDNKFYVVNVSTLESNEVVTQNTTRTILHCEWLYNRDRVIIAEQRESSDGKIVDVLNYDPENKDEELLKQICDYTVGMKVDDIAVSTANGVTYVEVSNGEASSSIYRIDINEAIDRVAKCSRGISSLEVFQYNDKMVYIDNYKNEINIYSDGKTNKIQIGSLGEMKIISLVGTQKIYLGEEVNGKITEIVQGDINQASSTWTKQKFSEGKEINDIFVNDKGDILVDNNNGSIQNLSTGATTSYEGVLVKIRDGIIFSLNNGKVCIKECT